MDEILTGLAAYGITMLFLWVVTRKDQKVRKNWKKPFGVIMRMAALFLLLHLFLITLPFETWKAYLFVVFAIAFSFLWQLFDFDLLVVAIVFWLVYQWAFWFPVKNEIILKSRTPIRKEETYLSGSGVASTDLRPIGRVVIDGKEHTAISTLGFIDAGERIVVEGSNGMELRVRRETNS